MSEWRELTLSQITEPVKKTYMPKSDEQLAYIGLEHIEQGTLRLTGVGTSADVTSNKFKFEANDVLFGKLRPYFRKVYKPKFSGICSTDIWVFKSKKGFVQDFLFYFLANWDFVDTANSGEGGTRMPRADWNFLKTTSWLVPCEEEQKAIASVLGSLDDKIDLLHRQNTTLERMAETLFRQWFVEEAQVDWEEKSIGELVKVIDNRGKTPPYSDLPSAYPLIEVNALTGNNRLVDYSVVRKFVDEQTFKTWFRGHPKKYDSLLSTVGSIGEISMFLVERGSIAQNVIALSTVNICPIYLFEALKNIKDKIKELDIGSVQPSIKVPHLLSLKIKIPSKHKLDNFSIIVKSQLEKMVVNYHQIQTLEKLRDNLLPKLMSGEVRVEP